MNIVRTGIIMSAFLESLAFAGASLPARPINPSQAYSQALAVAEDVVRTELGSEIEYHIYGTSVGIGKYTNGQFGDYRVHISLFKDESTLNDVQFEIPIRIVKVPFAKQKGDVIILEEHVNDYQIIAKVYYLDRHH